MQGRDERTPTPTPTARAAPQEGGSLGSPAGGSAESRGERIPYTPLCAAIGLILGWAPMFLHGPIPEKYNVLYIRGAIAVWGWYTARLLIGFVVGITHWPRRWYLRGPLCGLLMIYPLSLVSLATPGCGAPCMSYNLSTATAIGAIVAGVAYAVTGRDHG